MLLLIIISDEFVIKKNSHHCSIADVLLLKGINGRCYWLEKYKCLVTNDCLKKDSQEPVSNLLHLKFKTI